MEDENKSDFTDNIFRREIDLLAHYREFLSREELTKEEVLEEFEKFLKHYETLLKNTKKITKIGDASQSRLLKVKEKIENLNHQLMNSEKNIKELNSILMSYIMETDK